MWQQHSMSSLRDLLIWYNNLDVGPFVEAVQCMLQFYKEQGIDLFKESISIPGVARKLLFTQAAKERNYFSLFNKKHKHLYDLFKRNLIGGPSILFHRYAEAGKTLIRGEPVKKCRRVCGWDCNSLYLYCFDQQMPEGRYVLRHKGDGFVPHIRDKYNSQYDWLEWLSFSQNIAIQHGRNGGEYRVGLYFVERYHAASHTCYEFQGCWFHFHAGHGDSECVLTSRQKTSASLQHRCERTERRRQFIEKRGYHYLEIWECEWIDLNKNNPNVQKFMSAGEPFFF